MAVLQLFSISAKYPQSNVLTITTPFQTLRQIVFFRKKTILPLPLIVVGKNTQTKVRNTILNKIIILSKTTKGATVFEDYQAIKIPKARSTNN